VANGDGPALGREIEIARLLQGPVPGLRAVLGQVNLPPSASIQFFGDVQIDAKASTMTVHLRDIKRG